MSNRLALTGSRPQVLSALCRCGISLGRIARSFNSALAAAPLLLAVWMLSPAPAQAQVAYNGTQTTIISGILSGGQIGYGLAVDKSGNVFVSGMGQPNSLILEYPKSNGYQYNGVFLNTDFRGGAYGSSAYSIAFDNSGNLYVPAPQNNYLGIWQPGSYLLNATAYSTFPIGVGFGLDGNMYMADDIKQDIYEIPLNGGNGGNSGAIITPPCYPYSVAADSASNVYVPCGTQVLKYTFQGVGNYSESVVTGSLSNSGYSQLGIAVDRNGIVYICDSNNNRVLREVPKPDGSYGESQLPWSYNSPSGITLDNQGNLYVSDSFNGNVDEITFPTAQYSAQTLGSTSDSQSFSFNFASGTNIGKIASLTYGQPTGDFPFTTTCTTGAHSSSGNCTVTVSFSPTAPGTRAGAIVFYDQNGNNLLSFPVSGTGQAPQLVFDGALTSSNLSLPSYTTSAEMAFDGAGNLFVANQTVDVNNYPLFAGSILEYPYANGVYGAPVTIATMNNPVAVAVLGSGNLIVLCQNPTQDTSFQYLIYEVPKTQSGFGSPIQIASDGSHTVWAAVTDAQSNVYYLSTDLNDVATIYELPFDGYMYFPPVAVASGFVSVGGLTMDTAGNLYAAEVNFGYDSVQGGSILEFTASSGYKTSSTVATGLVFPEFLAIEPGGSLLVGNQEAYIGATGNIQLLPATTTGFGSPITLVSGLELPNSLAVDRLGNLFTSTGYQGGTGSSAPATRIFHRAQAPLKFASTPQGSTDAAGPQVAALENFGNQPLDFSAVSFPVDFPESSSESTDCSSGGSLAAGGICTLTIDFAPDTALPAGKTSLALSESVSITSNSMQSSNAVASVALAGTETLPITTLSLSPSTSSSVYGTPFTVTATVTGGSGLATTAPTGTVIFYSGASQLGTATLTGGASDISTATLAISGTRLAGGPATLTFAYSGDTTYAPQTSGQLVIQIAQATPAVALIVSPATIAPTKQATLKATVASGVSGVVPTGTVTFNYTGASAPGGAALNTVTLNAGTATLTQLLPSGYGAITATYNGAADFASATSPAAGVDVAALATTLNAKSSASQIQLGASVQLSASLSGLVAGYTPTGGFAFFANGVEIGSSTVSTIGTGSFTTSSLPVGTNSINVTYTGDSNYASETSYPIQVTANPDTSKIALSVSPAAPAFGVPVSIKATIATTDGSTAPTGSVSFILDGNSVGGGNLSGGSVSLAVGVLSTGVHQYQAFYSGDANYAQANSALASLTVAKAVPTVILSTPTTSPTVAAPGILTAHVASTLSLSPTGTVTFYNGSTSLGTVSLTGGTASITASLAAGAYSVTAKYNGDPNFAGTTSAAQPLTVAQSHPTVTLTSSPTAVTLGKTVLLKAVLSNTSSSHAPTGTIQLSDNGNFIESGNVSAGAASFTLQLPRGANAITATYSGDSNYLSSAVTLDVTVAPAASVTTLTISPAASSFGSSVNLSAAVTSAYTGAPASGFVEFICAGVLLSTQPLTGNTAVLSTSALPGGTDVVSARYLGDSNFTASTSSSKSIVVAKATPAINFSASASTSIEGAPVTLSATLTGIGESAGYQYPTGQVRFILGSTVVGSAAPVNGQATIQLSTLPAGKDSIVADYSGDTNFHPVESVGVVVTVSKGASNVTLTPSASGTQVGQALTLTAAVAGSGVTPSGKVTFYNGSTSLGSATLISGSASITPSLPAGSDSLSATYTGDTNYSGSSSTAITESVKPGVSQILLSASPGAASAGSQVTFTVDISVYGTTLAAGGNVSISCNGPFITNSPVTVTDGVATFSTTTLPSGYYPCEALYSGDNNFTAGNSNVIWLNIN